MNTYNDIVKRRLLTCRTCDDMQRTKGVGMTCGKFLHPTDKTCGCIIAIKARLLTFNCPQGKWLTNKKENNHG